MHPEPFNKIEIRSTSAGGGSIYERPGVGIQILIDDVVYVDGEDYYVDVKTFFQALPEPKAVVTFVGGCHIPDCCANGAWTELSADAWYWNERRIRLAWSDVFKIATSMIAFIEEHATRGEDVWCADVEQIDFYRKQLDNAENLVTKP